VLKAADAALYREKRGEPAKTSNGDARGCIALHFARAGSDVGSLTLPIHLREAGNERNQPEIAQHPHVDDSVTCRRTAQRADPGAAGSGAALPHRRRERRGGSDHR
jgi:hypothetical protein